MASSGQSAWNRNDPLTEGVVFEKRLADDIGQKWKDLGRALGFHQASIDNIEQEKGNNSKECCIAVIVRWLRRDGKEGATAGNLAEALTKIELKNLADRFPIKPSDTNRFQNDKMEETIRDICEQLINFVKENAKEDRKARELEDTVSKMKNKNKELEEEVTKMKNKNKELEEEVSRLRAINKELQDGEKQEVEVSKIKELEEEVSKIKELEEEVSKVKELEEEVSKMKNNNKELEEEDLEDKLSKETDEEARERRVSEKLQKYIRDLKTYVTSSLEVPEVKQDQLKTPVKLDILKTLSEHLGDLYIGTRDMVSETCKCSEDLKREFYDFGYHGLRADHNELIHRVKDLDDTVQEMSEEEKEELQKLKEFQMNRESLIKELEEKWRVLFSPPEQLSGTRSFLTIGRGEKSTDNKKVKRNTDPGTRPKQRNVRDKRLQNPQHLSIGRKTLKRLQFGTLHYQRLNES